MGRSVVQRGAGTVAGDQLSHFVVVAAASLRREGKGDGGRSIFPGFTHRRKDGHFCDVAGVGT